MRMSFARPLLRACLCAVVLQQAVWASAFRLQLGTATAMRSGGRSGHSDVVCCGRRRWQPGMCTSAASDDELAAEVQSYAERPLMFTDREAGKVGDKGAATLSPEADVMDAPLDLSGMPAWSQCPPWQAPAPSSGRVCWLRAACTSRGRGQPTGCSATAAGAERAASKVAYLTARHGSDPEAAGEHPEGDAQEHRRAGHAPLQPPPPADHRAPLLRFGAQYARRRPKVGMPAWHCL